jgi:site-specific DNA recombinase
VGRPPYGYEAEKIPHPVPARRADGRTKNRLVPDPARAQIVHQIFTWRTVDLLGYAEIAERLNSDLVHYPPPTSPDPARCRDRWSRSSVHDLLANPKYTGYMVWNRRATKKGGRFNPPEMWVWSEQPTHEPVVTREMFHAAANVAKKEQRSRDGAGPSFLPTRLG